MSVLSPSFGFIAGQASSENAKAVGALAELMAKTGWKLASQGTGSNGHTGGGGLGGTKRMYSTSAHVGSPGNFARKCRYWITTCQ